MSDKIGLFTGSFDPMTLGHLDLIERASRLFDCLYVGIFFNHEKKGYFTIEQREAMVTESVAHLSNVRVITSEAELRNSQDFLYESNMDYFNHQLAPELETIYLCAQPQYQALSSTRIRELLTFQQDVSAYVPESVIKEMK